jgi:hypothetical protein
MSGFGGRQEPRDSFQSYTQKIWRRNLQDTINITESGDFQLAAVLRYDRLDGDTA